MNRNRQQDAELQRYLNNLMDDMPLLEPTSGLTDRIMQRIRNPLARESQTETAATSPVWKRAVVHGFVAMAATIVFIHSGILDRIMTIDTQMSQLSAYIERISQLLNS
jgi:hypothetical protein